MQTKQRSNTLRNLIHINEAEVKAIQGDYYQFTNGNAYMPKDHLYAADIDILGQASVYQFFNRTQSDMGAKQLAAWFLSPTNSAEIIRRQIATKELSLK